MRLSGVLDPRHQVGKRAKVRQAAKPGVALRRRIMLQRPGQVMRHVDGPAADLQLAQGDGARFTLESQAA